MESRVVYWLQFAAVAALLIAFGWFSAVKAIDFPIYHGAASQLLHGNADIYPQFLTEGGGPAFGHAFRYAPAVAFLFVPLALIPEQPAAFLFFWLKIPAFVYMWRVIARRMHLKKPYGRLILLSVLITGGYLAEEFRNGNLHFLMIALMVLAFDLAERGRIVAPAAALAVAIAAKILPVVLLVYWVMRRRFAVAVTTMAAVGVLGVLPAAWIGWEANARLTRTFLKYAVLKIDEQANHSLRGTLFRYLRHNDADDPRNPDWNVTDLPERTVSTLWIVVSAVAGVVLFAVLWRDPVNEESRLLDLALLLTAMVVGSPHTQRIHFASLLFPVAVVLAIVWMYPRGTGIAFSRLALWTVGLAATVMPLVLSTRRLAVAFEALSPQFLAAVVLGIALIVLAVRFRTEAVSTSRSGV